MTTRVQGARGWRVPVALVATIVVLAVAAVLVAFLELADDTERIAQAPQPTPTAAPPAAAPGATPTPAPAAGETPTPAPGVGETPTPVPGAGETPTPTPGADAGEFAAWPAGEAAWTVILHSAQSREDAEARAQEFQNAGTTVGMLRSDDYATLRPGYWVVFSGQYETQAAAEDATESLRSTADDAYPRLVEPR